MFAFFLVIFIEQCIIWYTILDALVAHKVCLSVSNTFVKLIIAIFLTYYRYLLNTSDLVFQINIKKTKSVVFNKIGKLDENNI